MDGVRIRLSFALPLLFLLLLLAILVRLATLIALTRLLRLAITRRFLCRTFTIWPVLLRCVIVFTAFVAVFLERNLGNLDLVRDTALLFLVNALNNVGRLERRDIGERSEYGST